MSLTKTLDKTVKISRIVVIGTSAGGLEALIQLTGQLSEDFPAPVLVVQHISADSSGNILLNALAKHTKLKCSHARNLETLQAGHLYLAPSDHHLMVDEDSKIIVTKGAHENRSRPAIDPLFRSAAVAFANGTIGILLTGYLDDGTNGLKMIQRCGGSIIIQDPKDAAYPEMPQNALNQVKPDFCVPIKEMGSILSQLIRKKLVKMKSIPKDVLIETEIAKRVVSDLKSVNFLGEQVPFNCPECGGVLWKIDKDTGIRYRCHVGHAFTSKFLLAEQTKRIEETMWTALRMFEERKNLLTTLAKEQSGASARSSIERAELSQVHIDRIMAILKSDDKGTSEDVPH